VADGYEAPMAIAPPGNTAEAMIHLASRLGGIEQALRGVVTYEKLMTTWNDLRRDVQGMVRDNEIHVRGAIDASEVRADKRIQDLQGALETAATQRQTATDAMIANRIDLAVAAAFEAQKVRESDARREIENKAKDAARGVRIFASSLPPLIAGVFVAAGFVAWMWFTGKL